MILGSGDCFVFAGASSDGFVAGVLQSRRTSKSVRVARGNPALSQKLQAERWREPVASIPLQQPARQAASTAVASTARPRPWPRYAAWVTTFSFTPRLRASRMILGTITSKKLKASAPSRSATMRRICSEPNIAAQGLAATASGTHGSSGLRC